MRPNSFRFRYPLLLSIKFCYGGRIRTCDFYVMSVVNCLCSTPWYLRVIISTDPLVMTLRCQTASFEHNLSSHKNTQVIGLSVSYVEFTLRTAILYIDARIGIEPILQVPKTWVISHYTIEQTCFVNANIQLRKQIPNFLTILYTSISNSKPQSVQKFCNWWTYSISILPTLHR